MLDADVILSGSFAYPSGAAAMYWAKRNARSVVQFDDIRPEDVPRNRLVNYVKRLLYREVDAILCPAPSWTEGFLRWGFKAEQLFFGVDVVDNDFWGRELEDAGEGDGVQLGGGFGELGGGLGELGGGEMDRGPIVVEAGRSLGRGTFLLAVGRQIPAKNFIFLLEVYERYREALEQRGCLPLVLIGEGPERRAMESFIRSRALEGVHFFPFAGPERLRLFYRYAAALVLPSRLETWGLVVNEAMAAGLPVLVSKACGCASVLVEEGLNGYTFSPYNQEQLLDILLRFTGKEPAARAAMGRTSKEIVRSWGLDQFVKGSLQAIDYAATHRKKTKSIQARFVLKNWKGRYRPV